MKSGTYRCVDRDHYSLVWNGRDDVVVDHPEYDLTISVRDTGKSYIFNMLENNSRYMPGYLEMLFKKPKVTINKEKNPHAILEDTHNNSYFVIYPYRGGVPFTFDLVS